MNAQRGSGALVMVIILLLMGTAMLHASRRQLSDNLSLVHDESLYIRQYALAASALAWGARLTWRDEAEWHCQTHPDFQWRACITERRSGALLRGDSGSGTLSLYRWVDRQPDGRVLTIPHGWIDYCPLTDKDACNDV